MTIRQENNKQGSWSKAFTSGLGGSFAIMATVFVITTIISLNQKAYIGMGIFDFLIVLFGSYAAWSLIIGVITLMGLTVVGIPTLLILKKLNMDSSINAAKVGAFSVFFFLLIMSKGQVDWYYLIFETFGFVSGYAFMHGYKKV